jgi:hypothetical protein
MLLLLQLNLISASRWTDFLKYYSRGFALKEVEFGAFLGFLKKADFREGFPGVLEGEMRG